MTAWNAETGTHHDIERGGEDEWRSLVTQFYDVLSTGDTTAFHSLLGAGFVDHVSGPVWQPAADGFFDAVRALHAGFADLHFEIENLVVEYDRVAAHVIMSGTHRQSFLGIPATSRHVRVVGVDIFTVENGRIAERRGNFDDLGLLAQLGVRPVLRR